MNSIKRITKRVKSTMFALVLDVRGEHAAFSPAVLLGGAAAVGAAGVAAQQQFGATKAGLDTAAAGHDAVATKLAGIAGAQDTPTPKAVDPTAAQ